MKKPIYIILFIFLLIFGLAGFLVWQSSDSVVTNTGSTLDSPQPSSQDSTNQVQGRYIDYSPGIIEKTEGTKILFFHAPWCPQCRDLEADIVQSGLPEGVTVVKVDYDTNQELRRTYDVTLQTTLVLVDDNGALVKKFVAYQEPTVASLKSNLL
jgi:thiol-disulfide isomerase/thioredoxin